MDTLLKIFVVDDEYSTRVGLEKILTHWGNSVYVFSNGYEAIEELKNTIPDVIISDYKMEGLDGMELLKIIKKEFPEISFIMLTAYGSEKLAVEAIKKMCLLLFKKTH